MSFDVTQIDELLATTRAVRVVLDLDRPVDSQLVSTGGKFSPTTATLVTGPTEGLRIR